MAGEITVEQLQGIASSTLNTFKLKGKPVLLDLTTDVNEYLVLPKLLDRERIRTEGGKQLEFTAMVDHAQSFEGVGLHDENGVTIKEADRKYYVPWRHVKVSTGWELHEIDMNSGKAQIYNLIKSRWDGMNIAEADGFERAFWYMPGEDGGLLPFPIQYYACRHVTETSLTTGGLNGTTNAWSIWPASISDTKLQARFKNWTFAFTNYTADDLLEKWWRAYLRCRYQSPVPSGQMSSGRSRREFFVTTEGLINLRKLAENRNDNLGYDLGISPDGGVKFGGCPIYRVPLWDEISCNESTYEMLYGIDWANVGWTFLQNWYRKQYGPKISGVQRNSVEVIRDSSLNLWCGDRRTLMVGSKAA